MQLSDYEHIIALIEKQGSQPPEREALLYCANLINNLNEKRTISTSYAKSKLKEKIVSYLEHQESGLPKVLLAQIRCDWYDKKYMFYEDVKDMSFIKKYVRVCFRVNNLIVGNGNVQSLENDIVILDQLCLNAYYNTRLGYEINEPYRVPKRDILYPVEQYSIPYLLPKEKEFDDEEISELLNSNLNKRTGESQEEGEKDDNDCQHKKRKIQACSDNTSDQERDIPAQDYKYLYEKYFDAYHKKVSEIQKIKRERDELIPLADAAYRFISSVKDKNIN
jgi:hypothetical protein